MLLQALLPLVPAGSAAAQACYPILPDDPYCGFLAGVQSRFTQGTGPKSSTDSINLYLPLLQNVCAVDLSVVAFVYCMGSIGPCNGASWSLPADPSSLSQDVDFFNNAHFADGLAAIQAQNAAGTGAMPPCIDACRRAASITSCWALATIGVHSSADPCAGLPTTNCVNLPGKLKSGGSAGGAGGGAGGNNGGGSAGGGSGTGGNAGNAGGSSGGAGGGSIAPNSLSPGETLAPGVTSSPIGINGTNANPSNPLVPLKNGTLGVDNCPVCFSCSTYGCPNFGVCDPTTNSCSCPTGFGGADCLSLLCESSAVSNAQRTIIPTGQSCSCSEGYSGPNCNICQSDNACPNRSAGSTTGADNLVCNKTPLLWNNQYSYCTTNVDSLQTIYPGSNTISIDRNITSGVALGALYNNGTEQFICKMTGCNQTLSSSGDYEYVYSCAATTCACAGESTFCGGPGVRVDLTKTLASAKGAFQFRCKTQNSTSCNAYFEFLKALFPNGIPLPSCDFGECAFPNQNPSLLASAAGTTALSAGQYAGIILSVFVMALLAGFLIWAIYYHVRATRATPPKPLTGLTLTFSKLSYTLKSGQKILRNVSGIAPAGKVLAILGPSGAGKSTFLDIIGGKDKTSGGGCVEGEILVDGRRMTPQHLSSLVGFVDQEDLLMPHLTVRETIMFSACLRLPESIGYWQKVDRVTEVMKLLGLSHVADTKCGGFGMRGISGGERRRVSIGVELVTSPAVLLLDEPTSGLDSHAAHQLIKNLTDLAHNEGKTIIFTIHQPRSDIYALFDRLLVLSVGTPLYSGPAGKTVSNYLRDKGQQCPERYNMADHLLDLAAQMKKDADARNLPNDFNLDKPSLPGGWFGKVSSLGGDNRIHTSTISKSEPVKLVNSGSEVYSSHDDDTDLVPSNTNFSDPALTPQTTLKIGFITQLKTLMYRSAKILIRTPSLLLSHLILSVVMGLFVGGVYFDSGSSISGIQNRLGSVLFLLALIGFSSLSAIGSFANERNLFMRERSNNMYSPMSFYLSKIIFDIIPLRILPSLIMGLIAFFMIGYSSTPITIERYLTFLGVFSSEMGLLCLLFGVTIADVGTATLTGAIVVLFQMLFAGALINDSSLPSVLSWLQYLSFFRYAYEGLCVNDLVGVDIVDVFDGVNVNFPASLILVKFGFNVDNYVNDFIASVVIMLGLLIINGVAIEYRLKERR